MKNCGEEPVVIYDKKVTFFDATIIWFVHWHILIGVVNKTINKTAKYKFQDILGEREEREKKSRKFNIKYLLAIMNSSFTKKWLDKKRRHKISIYPDDWKQLPIAPISLEEQKPFVRRVDAILAEFDNFGYPLPPDASLRVIQLEQELDEMVTNLYGAGVP